MAARVSTAPPRGMRDILPPEVELRDAATQQILSVYRGFGFRRVETPALESLKLLAGQRGRREREADLQGAQARSRIWRRLSAGAASSPSTACVSTSPCPWPATTRRTMPACPIRSRRSRSGRCGARSGRRRVAIRQFTQCDIDVLGVGSGLVEVELILATSEALDRLGLTDLTVRINDRRILGAHRSALRLRRGPAGGLLHRLRQARQDRPGGRARRAARGRLSRRGHRAIRGASCPPSRSASSRWRRCPPRWG